MKWIAILLFIAAVPMVMSWLRTNHQRAPMLWTAMGFMPFVMDPWHLQAAPISWALWPGYVKGVEVSLLDACALAVVLTSQKVRVKSPIFAIVTIYMLVVLSTMAWSSVPMAAMFYVWQLCRVLLLFTAVAKICMDERGPQALVLGMSLGICFQAGVSIQQRLGGMSQARGTFDHQNLLGMVSHFVTFPALALLLRDGRRLAPVLGVIGGAIVIIFGASRATVGLAGAGFVALLVLSMVRRATPRKSMIVGLGLMGLVIAAPIAMSSLQQRFAERPVIGNYDERAAFSRAAKLAIADHPMGVGANQYVVVANTQGYSDRAGVVWNRGSRSANVHNTYLLVQAETGYLGLAAFVALLGFPILAALRGAWRNRKDPRGELVLGIGVGLLVVSVHCFYEWIFVQYSVEALFAIDVGIMTALLRQMASDKTEKHRAQPRLPMTEMVTATTEPGR